MFVIIALVLGIDSSSGDFNQTHVFTMICGNKYGKQPTVLIKQDYNEVAYQLDSLLPTGRNRKAKQLNA